MLASIHNLSETVIANVAAVGSFPIATFLLYVLVRTLLDVRAFTSHLSIHLLVLERRRDSSFTVSSNLLL